MCCCYWNKPTGGTDSTVGIYKGSLRLIFFFLVLLYNLKIDLMNYLFADFFK